MSCVMRHRIVWSIYVTFSEESDTCILEAEKPLFIPQTEAKRRVHLTDYTTSQSE
jgi:hypothetical protein